MISFELVLGLFAGLVIFLYGIENFSREVQRLGGEKFREILARFTKTPLRGTIFGGLVTAVVQSSTAVTVIAVGLVNAGTISFSQSLGVIFGANIGTTITGQLIAFKLTSYASVFLIAGFIAGLVSRKYRVIAKSVFYFGLLFFGLNLISGAIEPVKNDPMVVDVFKSLTGTWLTLAAGLLATVVLQSSSVTTGIVIILAQSGLLSIGQAFPILLGANIGTTVTSMLASLSLSLHSKRAAAAHLLFNVGGVILVLPFLAYFTSLIESLGGSTAQQIANAHSIFNVVTAAVFLTFAGHFQSIVLKLVPGEEEEILFKTRYLQDPLPQDNSEAFKTIEAELRYSLEVTKKIFANSMEILRKGKTEPYNLVEKLESLNDYIDDKVDGAITRLSERKMAGRDVERITFLIRISHSIEELGDSARILGNYLKTQIEAGVVIPSQALREMLDVYGLLDKRLTLLLEDFPLLSNQGYSNIKKLGEELRGSIQKQYEQRLVAQKTRERKQEIFFVEYISCIENANSRLVELRKLSQLYTQTLTSKQD